MRAPLRIIMAMVFALLIYAPRADSATINAASCSASNVQAAINSARDGDTVNIPAGSCTWNSQVTVNAGITLQGAGIGKTTITDNVSSAPALFINSVNGKSYRVTGLSWVSQGAGKFDQGSIGIKGDSQSVRIDNMSFNNTARTNTISWKGDVFGVIDHCAFATNNAACLYIEHDTWGGYTQGDGSWASPLTLGTNQALYVENNTFDASSSPTGQGFASDCECGARVVFRYNKVLNAAWATHGTESGGRHRAPRSFEIYDNTFVHNSGGKYANAIHIRGGSGVIFDNTYSGYDHSVTVSTFRTFQAFKVWGACNGTNPLDDNDPKLYASGKYTGPATGGVTTVTFSGQNWSPDQWVGFSLIDTTQNVSSIIAGNTSNTITFLGSPYAGGNMTLNTGDSYEIRRAYQCLDQPGAGSGLLLTGNPPVLQSTGQPGWPKEGIDGIYEWNDTSPDGSTYIGIIANTPDLKEGVDFFDNTKMPGYTPYVYPHPLVSGQQTTIPAPTGLHLAQ